MDYKKQCWFCGKDTMELKDTYYQCTSCGATWVDPPELPSYIGLERERNLWDGRMKYKPVLKRGRVLPPRKSPTKK